MAKKEVKDAEAGRVDPDAMQAFTEPEPIAPEETIEVVHGEGKDEERLQKILKAPRRKKAASPSKK